MLFHLAIERPHIQVLLLISLSYDWRLITYIKLYQLYTWYLRNVISISRRSNIRSSCETSSSVRKEIIHMYTKDIHSLNFKIKTLTQNQCLKNTQTISVLLSGDLFIYLSITQFEHDFNYWQTGNLFNYCLWEISILNSHPT